MSTQEKKSSGKSKKSSGKQGDKFRHSAAARKKVSKGGGHGGWGMPGDEIKYSTPAVLNENDPNYDPEEAYAAEAAEAFNNEEEEQYSQRKFESAALNLSKFKAAIKEAADEYLNSNDLEEFAAILKELNSPIFHQDLPYILMKYALDKPETAQLAISTLMRNLETSGDVSVNQMGASFSKLVNKLDDLLLDNPNAVSSIRGFIEHAVSNSYLDAGAASTLATALAVDPAQKTVAKKLAQDLVQEYLENGDVQEAHLATAEVDALFHYEVVKQLVSTALDRNNRERELASVLLPELQVRQDQTCKAFTILLERVDDLFLDVPNIMSFLSCFLARAVSDEAIPPSFLVRLEDLAGMATEVIANANRLLAQSKASLKLSKIWKLRKSRNRKKANQKPRQQTKKEVTMGAEQTEREKREAHHLFVSFSRKTDNFTRGLEILAEHSSIYIKGLGRSVGTTADTAATFAALGLVKFETVVTELIRDMPSLGITATRLRTPTKEDEEAIRKATARPTPPV